MTDDAIRIPELKDITFIHPLPVKHMEPHGLLPMIPEAAALWQFLIGAFQALDRVPKQTTLEGTPDKVVDLMQIAESVRKMYGLENLEGMFQERLIAQARREAFNCRLPWNDKIDAFFASGGKAYRIQDRDPDKVGL